MNGVATARHGPILRQNGAAGSRKVFKCLPGLRDTVLRPKTAKKTKHQKHLNKKKIKRQIQGNKQTTIKPNKQAAHTNTPNKETNNKRFSQTSKQHTKIHQASKHTSKRTTIKPNKQATHQINQSNKSTNQSNNQSINQSFNQPIIQSINQTINQTINQ